MKSGTEVEERFVPLMEMGTWKRDGVKGCRAGGPGDKWVRIRRNASRKAGKSETRTSESMRIKR